MSGTFAPHLEILPPAQLRLWPELRQSSELRLVLYGGTAVALRLGHRHSVDFDFFTEAPLDHAALRRVFPFLADATGLQEKPNALTVLVEDQETADTVKVSFFGDVEIGRVGEPSYTEDGNLEVASLEDLMGTKLKVMLQRVEARDYLDIAAMLEAGIDLPSALAGARAMFGPSFQPSESLKALTYFEDGLEELPEGVRTTLIQASTRVRDLPSVSLRSRHLSGLAR